MKVYVLFVLPMLFMGSLLGQSRQISDEPIELPIFGEMTRADFKIKPFPTTEDAPALWLLDAGHVFFSNTSNEGYIIRRHQRLKILQESGVGLADRRIRFDLREENLVSIKAATYNLNPDGEVVQFKLPKRALKIRKINKYEREVNIDFPLVRVGTVVEIWTETRKPQSRLIGPWAIQEALPVARSLFRIDIPRALEYQPIISGAFGTLKTYQEPYVTSNGNGFSNRGSVYNGISADRTNIKIQAGETTYFLVEDVPAGNEDAYISQSELLKIGITFQLIRDARKGPRQGQGFRNWEQVYKYGQKRLRPRKLRLQKLEVPRTQRRALRKLEADEDKVRYLYNFVQKKIKWDGTYEPWPGNLERVWRRERGTSSALNMIFLYMLREADIEAYPVFISTLDHGLVIIQNPGFSYFDHMIVNVPIDGDTWLIDLAGPNASIEVLPEQDLNQIGLVMGKESPYWVPLRAQNKMVRFTYGRFSLREDAQMEGDIIIENAAQRALVDRERLANWEGTQDSFWKDYILAGLSMYELFQSRILNDQTDDQSLVYECSVSTSEFSERVGDLLFLRPMLIKQVTENPFRQASRSAPVDLSYPLRESYLLGVRLPEGFVVEQLPEPVRVVLPHGGGTFVYNVTEIDNILHISSTIYLDQTLFMPEEYSVIQDFFRYVVQKHQESVVLKRTNVRQ